MVASPATHFNFGFLVVCSVGFPLSISRASEVVRDSRQIPSKPNWWVGFCGLDLDLDLNPKGNHFVGNVVASASQGFPATDTTTISAAATSTSAAFTTFTTSNPLTKPQIYTTNWRKADLRATGCDFKDFPTFFAWYNHTLLPRGTFNIHIHMYTGNTGYE